jgi:uncharacterized membrane protein YeaQ/YmgE (transglycosylase-associated protein family)
VRCRQCVNREASLGIVSWIVLGAIAGWLISIFVNKSGERRFRDIVLGIVGGVVGGWIFAAFGAISVTGLNLWSLFVALVGAVFILSLYRAVVRRPTV